MAISNGYATLTEIKLFLGITDSVDDTLLEGMVEAASRSIDRMANRRFYLDATATARLYRANDALQLQYQPLTLRELGDCVGSYYEGLCTAYAATVKSIAGLYQQTLMSH